MTKLDDFFNGPVEFSHPRLRHWKARLDAGASATLEIDRPETGIGYLQSEMNLEFTQAGRPEFVETVLWDDDLNTGLIHFGVRSIDLEQEAERFALGLRAALRKAAREFGDGFLNAVLIELLKDSDLVEHREIANVLEHISTPEANHDRNGYYQCREMIADAISGRAHELTENLNYSQDVAKGILVAAIARYLDERFSVSSRRQIRLP